MSGRDVFVFVCLENNIPFFFSSAYENCSHIIYHSGAVVPRQQRFSTEFEETRLVHFGHFNSQRYSIDIIVLFLCSGIFTL